MSNLQKIITKHVLKNAFDYGKANPGAVMGKVISEFPDCKKDTKTTMASITSEIKRVSKLSKDQMAEEMKNFEYKVKEQKQKTIELPHAEKGKVVTRFPPEPSGYAHIGHAKAVCLNFEAAQAYDGYMILRFDDTNPEKESKQFVDAIRDGLTWLGIKWKKETYTSDNMDKIYAAAEKLIKDGNAYLSTASRDELSDSRTNSKPLPERASSPEENMKKWKSMLSGKYKKGEALLLFKGDLNSDNTVMRDPALARIMDSKHYRQKNKYIVWPGYDLAVVVMDHLEGITHPMRSKEYELRDELYYTLFDALGWKKPNMVPFSRLSIKNAPISKRLITPLVNEKKVSGWDDPRLPTLAGLKRRGLLPEAIKKFVLSFGLSKVESEPDWEVLLSENRKLLDQQADHYFFVADPVKLVVKGLEKQKLKLPLHPKKKNGFREFNITNTIYISKQDADSLEQDEVFRLKDLCNAKLVKKGKTFEAEFAGDKIVPKKLQWVTKDFIDCKILILKDLLDDGVYNSNSLTTIKGYCEHNCKKLKQGSIIQFERFGFCVLDSTKTTITFIYAC